MYQQVMLVSIHAGRDNHNQESMHTSAVSIHAPTRGATIPAEYICQVMCFNPRAHAGRDINKLKSTNEITVSIHAPTRGAT